MEAQWSPQWSLNGRHWSSKGGTMVVQGRQTCRSNWYTMFAFLTGRPMADHCASILRPRRCVCLHPASFERPVSDRPPRRPLCDCFEHAQNFTATMASMAMPERPVYHPWTTKATVLPPFCLQRRPGQFCGRTREAQRSQPLCKGGISDAVAPWLYSTCPIHALALLRLDSTWPSHVVAPLRPFYPWPFRPKGYCHCLRLSICLSVRPSVRKLYLVRTITRHRFELESPNLLQTCILGYSQMVLKMEVIIPSASTKLKGGIMVSPCPSVRLWTESCPLCILDNTHRIHFIFAHLIKQLQKVCCV